MIESCLPNHRVAHNDLSLILLMNNIFKLYIHIISIKKKGSKWNSNAPLETQRDAQFNLRRLDITLTN